jgi:L-rhamnonate dehydratase
VSIKITSIECLRLIRPRRVPKTKRRTDNHSRKLYGNPHPIHQYPEFARQRDTTPGEAAASKLMHVRVTAENGMVGIGCCHWGEYAASVVTQHLTPLLLGRDCLAIELLNDLMWRSSVRMGATGVVSSAQGAIDIALWDLKGKMLGVPVYSLLGGPCRPAVDLYATTNDFEWALELGFKAVKMRNSAHLVDAMEGLNLLEERVAEARDIVGPNIDLMLNAVMAYNVEYAVRVMDRLRPYRLRWLEEPLMPWNLEGHVEIKRAVGTIPIATGETLRGRHAFRQVVEHRAADVLQPDIRWTGGLSETLKIYTLAEAAGIQTIPHSGASMAAGQHFAFSMPESPMAEFMLSSPRGVPLEEVNNNLGMRMPANGKLIPSDAPGLGEEFGSDDFVAWAE